MPKAQVSSAGIKVPEDVSCWRSCSQWLCCRCCRRRKPRPMRIHERLFLNPFQKWQVFGVFPNTFFAHLSLLVMVTYQVMYYFYKDIDHACHTSRHFSALFLGTEEGAINLLQPEDLQKVFAQALLNTFDIDFVTFNNVRRTLDGADCLQCDLPVHLSWRNGSRSTFIMERQYFGSRHTKNVSTTSEEYLHTRLPFLYSSEIAFVEDIEFSFDIQEIFNDPAVLLDSVIHAERQETQFRWEMHLRFDGTKVGRFRGSLDYSLFIFDSSRSLSHDFMNILVLIMAVVSSALILRKVFRAAYVFYLVRQTLLQEQRSNALSWDNQLDIFNRWWGLSIVCHAMQIYATSRSMRLSPDVTQRFALHGWSCFLSWLNMCQYFESFPSYYVTFSTLKKGLPGVLRYMASVLPILTAFMFLGACNFWKAATFQGVPASYASLFSLLNGDMVHDAFDDLGKVGGWAGHVYLYIFIFMFIYVVLNVNITIIEEAYFAARFQSVQHERKSSTITDSIELSRQVSPAQGDSPTNRTSSLTAPLLNAAAALYVESTSPPVVLEASPLSGTANGSVAFVKSAASEASGDAESGEVGMLAYSKVRSRSLPNFGHVEDALSHSDHGRLGNSESVIRGTTRRITLKGNMSPRFLDNPQLQSALAHTFPEDFYRKTPKNVGGSSSYSVGTSLDPGAWRKGPKEEFSDSASPKDLASYYHPSDRIEWWLAVLPQWTQTLRSMPLPLRSSARDERQWLELEQVIADHSNAVQEVAGNFHRTVSRV